MHAFRIEDNKLPPSPALEIPHDWDSTVITPQFCDLFLFSCYDVTASHKTATSIDDKLMYVSRGQYACLSNSKVNTSEQAVYNGIYSRNQIGYTLYLGANQISYIPGQSDTGEWSEYPQQCLPRFAATQSVQEARTTVR